MFVDFGNDSSVVSIDAVGSEIWDDDFGFLDWD